jgi:hypothetical protein
MRRYLPAALVASGFLAGLLLLLLALDVSRVDRSLAASDARFPSQPRVGGYWDDEGILPLDAGRWVLGASDDVRHRRAVERFWRARPGDAKTPTPARLSERAQAQAALAAVEEAGGRGTAEIANLLGILALLTPPDQAERVQVVRAAGSAFRRAIVSDPTTDDAKFNLENILRLEADLRRRGQGGGGSAGQQGTDFGGAAVSRRGSGY